MIGFRPQSECSLEKLVHIYRPFAYSIRTIRNGRLARAVRSDPYKPLYAPTLQRAMEKVTSLGKVALVCSNKYHELSAHC
jgi:hypothetical protein